MSAMEITETSACADDRGQQEREQFFRIVADVMVERNSPLNEAAAEAITLAKKGNRIPRYFSGKPPRQEDIAAIEACSIGEDAMLGAGVTDQCFRLLYGDMFNLCMALKSRPTEVATAEDPNFSVERIESMESMFKKAPAHVREESLIALGGLLDVVLAQGCEELGASPPKLRALVLMITHPGLAEPACESFDVLKKLLQLVALLHAQTAARETLVKWCALLPLSTFERCVGQVQQFMTLSLLEAQAEHDPTSMDAVMQIAKSDDLARHTRNALRFLNIFWLGNERRREHSQGWQARRLEQLMRQRGQAVEDASERFLQVSHFHNDAVNECEGIFKHDLKEVLEMQHRGLQLDTVEEASRFDFGVVQYPFVLNPVSKVRMLSIESLVRQRDEVRTAMALQMMLRGRLSMNPWLVLKVRRSAVMEDTLQQLAIQGPQQFKKPLKIMFDGEEGVDEGGVQKEFFQLLIEELYNEDFGMFERVEESRNMWFNKNSLEANVQFELFGIVLGLAIYNQVILDVKFPMAVYKKLMDKTSESSNLGLSDLLDFKPSLAQGLIALLEHEDHSNFEEVFGPLKFVVHYECFGSMLEAELIEGGKDMTVTCENRNEYVQRYCDWIFNSSVQPQFSAFRKGFDQCIGDSLFRRLFRPEELELIICGSVELDFGALEAAAQYQDGFVATSTAVKWFWEVIHSLTQEEKKTFLAFSTGSDRSPVGGLGRLHLIVSRSGPDSDMLPSVHTCFNHILLPDYNSKEKLEERLRLAIQHSKGFGLM